MKKIEQNESGRSMVEMLGVLAIIGVLSLMGIMGYTMAMNNHRANEAVNNATRLAMLLSGKRLLNSEATLSADELAGTGFEWVENTDNIVLSVDVSDAVKSKVEGMGLTVASLNTATEGKITFTFNNDLSERSNGTQTGGNSGASGQEGTQTSSDPCVNISCQNGGTCSNGVCNCPSGYGGDTCEIEGKACSATGYCSDTAVMGGDEFCQMNSSTDGICQSRGGVNQHYMCNGLAHIYSYSNIEMNFWSAINWCYGHSGWGGSIVSENSGRSCPGGSSTCPNECFNKPYWDASGRICSIQNGTLICTEADPTTKAYAYCEAGR